MALAVVPVDQNEQPPEDFVPSSHWAQAAAAGPNDWNVIVLHPGNAHQGQNPRVRVRGKEKNISWRSLFYFRINSGLRQRVLAFVEWKWFDRFILFLIALSSIFMATFDWRGAVDDPYNVFVNEVTDPILLAFFSLEMGFKVVAWGFFLDKDTYLRDAWNWMDFIVVVTALIESLGLVENGLGFLRLFRILRPLRSLNAVPQMKVLVRTVVSSVPRLFNVIGVTVVLFVIFGSIGTTLFGGIFFRGCRVTPTPILISNPNQNSTQCWSWPYALACEGYCSLDTLLDEDSCVAAAAEWSTTNCAHDRLCGGAYMCKGSSGFCGASEDDTNWRLRPKFPGFEDDSETYEQGVQGCAPGLPEGEPCTSRKNIPWCEGSELGYIYPETEFINFDTIGGAILLIFQCMTMEGWTDVMYYVQDAFGFWVATAYFFVLLPITSFFLLNVALAVVDEAREDADDDQAHGEAEPHQKEELPPGIPKKAWGGDPQLEDDDKEESVSLSIHVASDIRTPTGALAPEPASRGSNLSPDSVEKQAAPELFMGDPQPDEDLWYDCTAVRILQTIAFSPFFVNCIMFFIAANVLAMSLESYPPIVVLQEPQNICEVIFLVVFCLEMVIMLGAMGPKSYVMNPVTCFDGIIVVISLVQQIITLTQASSSGGGGGSAFTALRTLRLFRVLNKLAHRNLSFRVLLKAMVATGASLRYWACLFVLVLYIFTLMWQTFFATRFHFEDPDTFDKVSADALQPWCHGQYGNQDCIPRANFDTFFWAIITIFQVMTGENWNTIMYAGIRSYEAPMRPFIAGLFMFLILFGQILFLSLFLSMLMAKFEEVKTKITTIEKGKAIERKVKLERHRTSLTRLGSGLDLALVSQALMMKNFSSTPKDAPVHSPEKNSSGQTSVQSISEVAGMAANVSIGDSPAADQGTSGEAPATGSELSEVNEQSIGGSDGSFLQQQHKQQAPMPTEQEAEFGASQTSQKQGWPRGYACFLLSETNPARKAAHRFLDFEVSVGGSMFKVFDNFILLCILLSSFAMAYDTPLNDPDDPLTQLVRDSNKFFAYIFMFELVVKLFAMGLIMGKGAYLRSGWNVLDGIVVGVSILGLITPGSGAFLKTLRILRAFRPLRVISRNPNLKVVVQTMFASMPQLATLIFVTCFFLVIFALFFLAFLSGSLYACQSPNYLGDEGALMSANMPEFVTPLCLGTNETHQSCPHGRHLSSEFGSGKEAEWVDESLTCQQSFEQSYCPQSSPDLTVPWKRATWDTPICIGRCNPEAQAKDPGLWQSRSWLCEADFTSAAEFPSSCKAAQTPAYLASMSPEEQRGRKLVDQLTRQLVMPCGGTTVDALGVLSTPPAAAAVSCREAFCPGEVKEEKKTQCKADCKIHPNFCWEACTDRSSVKCQACRSECEAQCQCSDFCEPLIKDAALCHEQGGKWMPVLSQNFDNFANALLTLFEIMSTEGWVNVMYAGSDATGMYLQPRRDANSWVAPFFAIYVFFSFMFLLNLSVGVIVDQFMELKRSGKSVMLTPSQQKWLETQKVLFSRKIFFTLTHLERLPPARKRLYRAVSSKYFENAIMVAILINAIFMMLKVFPQPTSWWDEVLETMDAIFAFVFLVEFMLKFYALQESYWKDVWNRFDFLCVTISVSGLLLSLIPALAAVGEITAVFRIFRIGRVFRFFQGLNKIFMAMILSIPKLANVCGILLLLLMLFSILGVSLFSTSKPGQTFNEHGNFKNFASAFITLFRASTGEAWNEIMHDLSKGPADFWREGEWCAPDELFDPTDATIWTILQSKCLIESPVSCTPLREVHVAVVFWVSYTLVITYMVMNLVIAVILEGYHEGKPSQESQVIDKCTEMWKDYDPELTMALEFQEAVRFINEVVATICAEEDARLLQHSSRTTYMKDDIGNIRMSYASMWESVLTHPDGKVSFMQSVKQVLHILAVLKTEPTSGGLEEGVRVEAKSQITTLGIDVRPGQFGTVTQVLLNGDAVVLWDKLGARLLPLHSFHVVTPISQEQLFLDMDNVADKVDKKVLDKLKRLEMQKSSLSASTAFSSNTTSFGTLPMNLRSMMCIVKVQRAYRARCLKRLSDESAKQLEDELSKRLSK